MSKLKPSITLVEAPHRMAVNETMMRYQIFLFGVFFSDVIFENGEYALKLPSPIFGFLESTTKSLDMVKTLIWNADRKWDDLKEKVRGMHSTSSKNGNALSIVPSEDDGELCVQLYGSAFGKAWSWRRTSGAKLLLPKPSGDIELLSVNATPAEREGTLARINALWAEA